MTSPQSTPATMLGWGGVIRIGLVQAALGSVVVLTTSTLNRVMVVELGFAASVPGILVALHYALQMLRPGWGHGADRAGRRTPWIIGGMAILSAGGVLAAVATWRMATAPVEGLVLATIAFILIGIGVGAGGTALLTLLAERVSAERKPAAGALVWTMMILGFVVTTVTVSAVISPFSFPRLVAAAAGVGVVALVVTLTALPGLERGSPLHAKPPTVRFPDAVRAVWQDQLARRFTWFIFFSMLAYSAQDLILEPFAGALFRLTPAQTTAITSLQNGGVLLGMGIVALVGRRFDRGSSAGLRRLVRIGCGGSALALAVIAASGLTMHLAWLRPGIILLGTCNGIFAAAAIALMMAMTASDGSAGVRMGVWGAAQAVAFGSGGFLGAAGVDALRPSLGLHAYSAVFLVEAAIFVMTAASMRAGVNGPVGPEPQFRQEDVMDEFDVAVVGGGPAGATAATDLASQGLRVLLLDRGGRIKPCGGAIPPRLIRDFAIPDELLCEQVTSARAVAPSGKVVDMPIDGGFVGMVDRDRFDEWLRERAVAAGAERRTGRFVGFSEGPDGGVILRYAVERGGEERTVSTRMLIGADGARSEVARQALPGQKTRHVFAYHEIIRSPAPGTVDGFRPRSCDVVYQGHLSPDFYAWIFPHGASTSVGVGSARKGFALRQSVAALRRSSGLDQCQTLRSEGAPIPLRPLARWDNGRNVLVIGDAAGVVAPASGEGIYYAMASARLGASAVAQALAQARPAALGEARRAFMAEHGQVFRVLGWLQAIWYRNDWLRERFVALCRDPDVQRLTWQAYMEKRMVRAQHGAHLRLMLANIANLVGARARQGQAWVEARRVQAR